MKVGRIDCEAIIALRDQLWAEAFARYDRGEQWHLPRHLERAQQLAAEEHQFTDAVFERLAEFVASKGEPFTTEEAILEGLGLTLQHADRSLQTRLGNMLRNLRCTRDRPRAAGERVRRWLPPPRNP